VTNREMKYFNKKPILVLMGLLTLPPVQSADPKISCYKGSIVTTSDTKTEKLLKKEMCDIGVTQCLKSSGDTMIAGLYSYGCSDRTPIEIGCKKDEKTLSLGVSTKTEKCVCNGNLCNSASTSGVNFVMAFSSFVISYLVLELDWN